MALVKFLLAALALTLAVELSLVWLFFGRKKHLRTVFLCNLITNPAANALLILAVYFFGAKFYWIGVVFIEAAVLISEALLIRALGGTGGKRALLMSFALNLASYLTGVAIQRIFFM